MTSDRQPLIFKLGASFWALSMLALLASSIGYVCCDWLSMACFIVFIGSFGLALVFIMTTVVIEVWKS